MSHEPKTLFEKVWEQHVVVEPKGEPTLLYIDLQLVHEVTSPQAFEGLRLAGRKVRRPDRTVATVDHNVPTTIEGRLNIVDQIAATQIARAPAEIVNLGGPDAVTTQEYCEMAGELLGKKPTFVENSRAWPIWADTAKMIRLLGPCKISMREGVRRVVESGQGARLSGKRHVIGTPEAA